MYQTSSHQSYFAKDSIQVIVLYNQQLRDRKVLKVRPSRLLLKVENTSKLQYHETLLRY